MGRKLTREAIAVIDIANTGRTIIREMPGTTYIAKYIGAGHHRHSNQRTRRFSRSDVKRALSTGILVEKIVIKDGKVMSIVKPTLD